MSKFGWDLPPGCSVRDIPGNRPEDEAQEAFAEALFDHVPTVLPDDAADMLSEWSWKHIGDTYGRGYADGAAGKPVADEFAPQEPHEAGEAPSQLMVAHDNAMQAFYASLFKQVGTTLSEGDADRLAEWLWSCTISEYMRGYDQARAEKEMAEELASETEDYGQDLKNEMPIELPDHGDWAEANASKKK